jgi:hypothetical protein
MEIKDGHPHTSPRRIPLGTLKQFITIEDDNYINIDQLNSVKVNLVTKQVSFFMASGTVLNIEDQTAEQLSHWGNVFKGKAFI